MGPKLSNPNQWLNPNIDKLLEVARSELTAPAPDLLEVLDSQPLLDGSPRNLRPEAGWPVPQRSWTAANVETVRSP